MENENLNTEETANSDLGAISSRLNVYEYIWLKEFPNEELNYDDFYDWARENAYRALELALEYCDLNER